ncbi:MAG: RNA methyltransferase [Anaerolineae bacterium]|nr:RNA methyltransferase [Anaerolineae bacterium]
MITSTKNPHIIEARKLAQRKHRLRQNRFLVEGLQLLSMAVQMRATTPAAGAKIIPREVFYSEALFSGDTAPRLLAQLIKAGAKPIPVAPNVLDTLSARDTSQGLIAIFALRELEYTPAELKALISQPVSQPRPNLILVLDQLQDPGNLGTLIRTADAVDGRAVILLEPAVDPFDPKTVRGTMGSLFTMPLARIKTPDELWPMLAQAGYRLVGADATRGETAWQSNVLAGSVALVLGNEARGLDPALRIHLTDYVSLPLRGHAESLNVAVAGGVLMYEWLRVNETRTTKMFRN